MTVYRNTIAAMLLSFPLAACGGDAGGGGGGGETAAFAAHCTEISNMEPTLCDCIAELASDELTPAGIQLLMTEDEAQAAQLRSQMSVDEMMQAGMFMTRAPGQCAAGG